MLCGLGSARIDRSNSSCNRHALPTALRQGCSPSGLLACAAELAASGLSGSPPRRVQRELTALPGKVLDVMARRTPASIMSGAVRHLAAGAVELGRAEASVGLEVRRKKGSG
jgi:hypothetical protein